MTEYLQGQWGADGFESDLKNPRFIHHVATIKLDREIEIDSDLQSFHRDIAQDLDFENYADYIAFVMKEVAMFWLKENPKRFGELIADAKIRGHSMSEL